MTLPPFNPVEKRRIEAGIVKLIHDEMVGVLGENQAGKILRSAITKTSVADGASYAEGEKGEPTPASYLNLILDWASDGTMEVAPVSVEADQVQFHITRCKYAEMYQKMGLADLGQILSCGRDGTVCFGYNSNLKLDRPQTIMQGASYCDFRLRLASAK